MVETFAKTRRRTVASPNVDKNTLIEWGRKAGQPEKEIKKFREGFDVQMAFGSIDARYTPEMLPNLVKEITAICTMIAQTVGFVPELLNHWRHLQKKDFESGYPGKPFSLASTVAYVANPMGTPILAKISAMIERHREKFSEDEETQQIIDNVTKNFHRKYEPVDAIIVELRNGLTRVQVDEFNNSLAGISNDMRIEPSTFTDALHLAVCRVASKGPSSSTLAYFVDQSENISRIWIHYNHETGKISLRNEETNSELETTRPAIEWYLKAPIKL